MNFFHCHSTTYINAGGEKKTVPCARNITFYSTITLSRSWTFWIFAGVYFISHHIICTPGRCFGRNRSYQFSRTSPALEAVRCYRGKQYHIQARCCLITRIAGLVGICSELFSYYIYRHVHLHTVDFTFSIYSAFRQYIIIILCS